MKQKTAEKITTAHLGKPCDQLLDIKAGDLMALPYPYDGTDKYSTVAQLKEEQKKRYEASLDGVLAVSIPKPASPAEEKALVEKFLSGLSKLLDKSDNWTFLQPLKFSLDYCARCQTCNEACPIFISSGRQEIYRPTYRAEVLRQIIDKYLHGQSKFSNWFLGNNVELNWTTIARLAELSYRCTICRRCTQTCPVGIDNGLITHELRKVFSQELGIAAKELHESGTMLHLKAGSSTGMNPSAFLDIKKFMEEEIEEKTGKKIEIPVDKKGADILLIHNAGEYLSWPENPAAFAIIFDAAGLNWTLSSELVGYDGVNYGVWYDDVQFSRVAIKHAQIAKELNVNRIVVGECGHAHKALIVIADLVLTGDLNIPRESCMPLLEDIVFSGKLKLDPMRNNFPVTLHDPCNMVRLMGVVEPQRRILRKIAPQFREMTPHGVENYCCGGGSGFAIMQSMNFPSWRSVISGRMKLKQVVDAFQDVISPDVKKFVCAPCSNCKGQFRDLFNYYDVGAKCGIDYTGLVDLIVNSMVDLKEPFLDLG